MDALSDLGLSEVAPQEGRPQVLWDVCRSGSTAHLTQTVARGRSAGGKRSHLETF